VYLRIVESQPFPERFHPSPGEVGFLSANPLQMQEKMKPASQIGSFGLRRLARSLESGRAGRLGLRRERAPSATTWSDDWGEAASVP